jgi:DNA-binding transcriptional LysR family regulator
MDKLAAMAALTKVVTLGSFAEAGRQLGLTRPAVSKAVMELETVLGSRLLDRATRQVGATEVGPARYGHPTTSGPRARTSHLAVPVISIARLPLA